MKVALGIYDKCYADVTSSTFSVSHLIIHPEFQYITRTNDIALLRLSTVVPFERRISPICLPTPSKEKLNFQFEKPKFKEMNNFFLFSEINYEHKVATIASWYEGLTPNGYETSTCQPRKIDLPIAEHESCQKATQESQGCVGVVGSSNILCRDDAGSGILYSTSLGYYELIGILSDYQSCAASSLHTKPKENDLILPIYTKVNSYLEWILFQTKDACYCNKI